MGYGLVPKPGKKIRNPRNRKQWIEVGPCVEDCQHEDCAFNKGMAASPCDLCGKPIGYDTPFYFGEKPDTYRHQLCEIRRVEAVKNAQPHTI